MDIISAVTLFIGTIAIVLLLILIFRKNDAASYRLQQELQDRLSSSFDSFRASMEDRMQVMERQLSSLSDSLSKSIDSLRDSEKKQMELFFSETRGMNERLAKSEKDSADSLRVAIDSMKDANAVTMEKVLKESSAI